MKNQSFSYNIRPMKVGLLIIASEILDGKIMDLNTKFLGEFLRQHHLELQITLTVKDIEADIHLGLKTLFESCDLIITSGGLGPTLDDLTKVTIASYLGRKISFSTEAEKIAQDNYRRFDREIPGKDHGYNYLPDGFIALSNSTGMAPGLFAEHSDHFIFSAPGVPREFKTMIQDHLMKLISSKIVTSFIETVSVRTKRVPEEKIFGEVDKSLWEKLSAYGDVSSLPILYGVDIGVKIRAQNMTELQKKKAAVLKIIDESPIKPHVWHIGMESIEEVIVALALKKKKTFGFAESCTGGLCSHRITNVSGSSQSFLGSVISYDNSVKTQLLSVQEKTLKNFGAVSIETAREMASGLAQELKVDIAISITGIAGPGGGSSLKPVGTVCIGSSILGVTQAENLKFFGDREQLKNRFSQAALMKLLEELEKFADH